MDVDEPNPNLEQLLPSWQLHLRAERKAAATIKSYVTGVGYYIAFCRSHDLAVTFDRATVNAFIAAVLDGGASPATARARQLAVRRFSAWATEEGEQSIDPLLGLRAPKLDAPVVQPLTDAEISGLVGACRGRDLLAHRDTALVRLCLLEQEEVAWIQGA